MQKAFLRTATTEDCDMLFEWANDSDVRKNSFSTDVTEYEDHVASYKKLMESTNSKQYILVVDNQNVGQLRVLVDDNKAEISYSIASDYRCMGYGKVIISLAAGVVRRDFPNVKTLVAQVMPDNVASQKAFLDNNYSNKCLMYELNIDALGILPDEMSVILRGEKKQQKVVLFLTNNNNALSLYDWLSAQETFVVICSNKINVSQVQRLNPDIIISYNYRHIIKGDVIDAFKGELINLHTSLLPWNRGASPNIWSFIEDTPKGVTIHVIDKGLDTGEVLLQEELFFDEKIETFRTSYEKLHNEIQKLFKSNWDKIESGKLIPQKQNGYGSYHTMKDLEKYSEIIDYDLPIDEIKSRLKQRVDE